jgi:succinate dehydrogenase / fumarate reductase membrane anchor subunit
MGMINPLARARGLGSAKAGVEHWYLQRASALLLLLLTAWLVYAMVSLAGQGFEVASAFISKPWNAACAVLLVVSGFYHAMISVQVVIEDYIHAPVLEWFLLFAV